MQLREGRRGLTLLAAGLFSWQRVWWWVHSGQAAEALAGGTPIVAPGCVFVVAKSLLNPPGLLPWRTCCLSGGRSVLPLMRSSLQEWGWQVFASQGITAIPLFSYLYHSPVCIACEAVQRQLQVPIDGMEHAVCVTICSMCHEMQYVS